MSPAPDIDCLEQLVVNSAPARLEQVHDGWLVRHTPHDVKRARSVTALSVPNAALEQQISWCERFYVEQELPPLFRLSPASQPETLDEALAARGYEVVEPTLVQVCDLVVGAMDVTSRHGVTLMDGIRWINAVGNFRQSTMPQRQSHLFRLNLLGECVHLYGALLDGIVVGTGAVVIDGDCAGIVDMHTREDYRGRGVATSILAALLEHAGSRGAKTAWLGVLAANEVALGLYAKFGFETVYQYWYRGRAAAEAAL